MSKRKQRQNLSVFDVGNEGETPALEDLAAVGYGDFAALVQQPERRIHLAEDGTLQVGRVVMTRTGIVPGTDMTYEEYTNLGEVLLVLGSSLNWLLGDWLAYGEDHKWGETYQQVADTFGYETASLHTFAWVCRQVQFSIRIENLSFGHHQLVAHMDQKDQRHWLSLASKNEWSIKQMRDAMKLALNPPEPMISGLELFANTPSVTSRMKQLWLKARGGDDQARQKALDMVAEHRKWLDEFEASLKE